jgi:integrase
MAPDLELDFLFAVIDRTDLSESTRSFYKRALKNYLASGASFADVEAFEEYAQSISSTSRTHLRATVRLLGKAFEAQPEDRVSQDYLFTMQPLLGWLEDSARAGRMRTAYLEKHRPWLSAQQVQELMRSCKDDLRGQRDWIVLALMVGAGLRRMEVLQLRFDDLSETPRQGREDTRGIINIRGKGALARSIPVQPLLTQRLREWHEKVGDGLVARSIGRKNEVIAFLASTLLSGIVRRHGVLIHKPDLVPHDLRLTYAQLGYEAGIPLSEISRLLGNSLVESTLKYLNIDFDDNWTVSDVIPLE